MNVPTLPHVIDGSGKKDRRVSRIGNIELERPSAMISARLLPILRLDSPVLLSIPGLRSLLQFPTTDTWSVRPTVRPMPVVQS